MAIAKTPKSTAAAPAPAVKSSETAVVPPAAKHAAATVNATPLAAPVAPPAPPVAAPVIAAKPAPVISKEPVKVAKAVEAEVVKPAPAAAAPAAQTLAHFSVSTDSVTRGVEELIAFGKANAEAVISSGTTLVSGLQHLAQSMIVLSHNSIEKTLSASQALAAAKSLQDVVQLSQSLAQDSFDHALTEGSRLGKLSSKLLEDAIAPVHSRLSAAVERISTPIG